MTTVQTALAELANAETLQAVRDIASSLSAKATGPGGVIYGGPIGDTSGAVASQKVALEIAEEAGLNIIDSTPRGEFLSSPQLYTKIESIVAESNPGFSGETLTYFVEQELYGTGISANTSLWGQASAEYASSLSGNITAVTMYANPYGVLTNVEAPGILGNPAITAINNEVVSSLPKTAPELIVAMQDSFSSAASAGGVFTNADSSISVSSEVFDQLGLSAGGAQSAADLTATGLTDITASTLESPAVDLAADSLLDAGGGAVVLLSSAIGALLIAAFTQDAGEAGLDDVDPLKQAASLDDPSLQAGIPAQPLVIDGQSVQLTGGTKTDEVALNGENDTLTIINPQVFIGAIVGAGPSDTIDLAGIGTAANASIGLGNVLTVEGGSGGDITLQLDPAQDFGDDNFIVGEDGSGGTDIAVVAIETLRVVFAGDDESSPDTSLYLSDGTPAGTKGVANELSGLPEDLFARLTPFDIDFDKKLLFLNDGLWVTNGTASGTLTLPLVDAAGRAVASLSYVSAFAGFGTGAVFEATDASGNPQVWFTDGTAAGTRALTNLAAGLFQVGLSGYPSVGFTPFGNKMLFTGADESGNFQLWITDGTVAGTIPLTSVAGRGDFIAHGLDASDLTAFGGQELFIGYDAGGNHALWITDGTPAGTTKLTKGVTPINPVSGSQASNIAVIGDIALFDATNGFTDSLWATDGTQSGTQMLTGFSSSTPLTAVGSKAIFFAGNPPQIWVTGGTAGGTEELTNAVQLRGGSLPSNLTVLGSRLLFVALDTKSQFGTFQLWTTDGTVAGSQQLTNFSTTNTGDPYNITVVGNRAFFQSANPTNGPIHTTALWTTDGTPAGTTLILNFADSNYSFAFDQPTDFTAIGDKTVFVSTDMNGDSHLWATDGTAGGTYQLTDVGGDPPSALTVYGDKIAFSEDGQLWITDGTVAGTRQITTPSGPQDFYLDGGQFALLDTSGAVNCYAAGTRIMMPHNEVAVEHLAIGDIVHTELSGPTPIRWIGSRHVDCRKHPHPERVWPVRISVGAFGDAMPHRDLLLSPDHAVYVQSVLISVRQLINGSTIVQVPMNEVTYYHVELERHDVLLAEGLPTESYLDTGNRPSFENGGVPVTLHPDFFGENRSSGSQAGSCAPLATAADQVEPIWRRLAARAVALGHPEFQPGVAVDPQLRLSVAGRPIQAISTAYDRYMFAVPPQTDTVQLSSRSGAPADTRPWLDDRRPLGVSVGRIVLRAGQELTDVPVDHPSLAEGWHGVERDGERQWRWTTGDAHLPLIAGTRIVEIHLTGAPEHLRAPKAASQPLAA